MARQLDKTLRKLGERLADRYRYQVEEVLPPQLSELVEELRRKEQLVRERQHSGNTADERC